ncbi:hypothetical protein SAMN05660733_01492 [Lentzea albidocapillata]|uniref:Uncharacterized protein n=1 Tax=Lentzea albidocapillata TaxID=40571 RepID=A0A1W2BHB1_9PSEU|nr:hypothetical protein SAMN05660733_01492 [Lentzea albidocapillata]
MVVMRKSETVWRSRDAFEGRNSGDSAPAWVTLTALEPCVTGRSSNRRCPLMRTCTRMWVTLSRTAGISAAGTPKGYQMHSRRLLFPVPIGPCTRKIDEPSFRVCHSPPTHNSTFSTTKPMPTPHLRRLNDSGTYRAVGVHDRVTR